MRDKDARFASEVSAQGSASRAVPGGGQRAVPMRSRLQEGALPQERPFIQRDE